MVGHDLEGVTVLDAFGGSGLLGLEAWSRGATVTVVERHPKAVATIRRNAEGLGAELTVVRANVLTWAADSCFDVVLADPPYAMARDEVLRALEPHVADRLVLEGDTSGAAASVSGLVMLRERCYGGTRLWLYGREETG